MSRLSNVQTNAASSSCPNAGSSSEHLLGLGDAAGWPRTGSVSIKKRSHSLSSPLSASCSENYAIQCNPSAQTLMLFRLWHPFVGWLLGVLGFVGVLVKRYQQQAGGPLS